MTTALSRITRADTQQLVAVTSADNVRVSGQLESGVAASVHGAAMLWTGSSSRLEISGRQDVLVATGSVCSQRGEMLGVQSARSGCIASLERCRVCCNRPVLVLAEPLEPLHEMDGGLGGQPEHRLGEQRPLGFLAEESREAKTLAHAARIGLAFLGGVPVPSNRFERRLDTVARLNVGDTAQCDEEGQHLVASASRPRGVPASSF